MSVPRLSSRMPEAGNEMPSRNDAGQFRRRDALAAQDAVEIRQQQLDVPQPGLLAAQGIDAVGVLLGHDLIVRSAGSQCSAPSLLPCVPGDFTRFTGPAA